MLIDGAPAAPSEAHDDARGPRGAGAGGHSPPEPGLIDGIVAGIEGDRLATLISTRPAPPGARRASSCCNAGWIWQGRTQQDTGVLRADDLQYLWLPLSHSFGKTLLCGVIY
ncbi:hypothetical protein GCM10020218_068180 [Dactylosporangium vinaceum]